jgi:uncharacterized protein (DUF1778 family)
MNRAVPLLTAHLNTRLSPEQRAIVDAAARKMGLRRADFARRAIMRFALRPDLFDDTPRFRQRKPA